MDAVADCYRPASLIQHDVFAILPGHCRLQWLQDLGFGCEFFQSYNTFLNKLDSNYYINV